IAIFCFAILLISISWLCFTRSLLLIPVIGIMFSAPWLYTIFTEYPQNKKKQKSILSEIDKMLSTKQVDKAKYQAVKAIKLEPWHELQLLAIELVNGKTLLVQDPDYSFGGMLYLGQQIEIYQSPYASAIFGSTINSSGMPIPVNQVLGDFYADTFMEFSESDFTVISKTLDEILVAAVGK
ncbi:MAG: hypothetical protein AAGF89_06255, partial [Bacteroidota bacterium]